MHMPRRTATALLALVPLLSLAGPAVAADGDPPPPTVVDVQLSRTAVSVRGLQGVKVTVSVHLKDPAGVVETGNPEIPAPWPLVGLERTSGGATRGAPRSTYLDLDLTSGTAQDGIWTATLLVPSTYEGTWQVSWLVAEGRDGAAGGGLYADPRTLGITRTLTVSATHQPSLSFGFAPAVVVGSGGPVAVKGRAVDADTGAPIAGLQLTLGSGRSENCGAFGYGGSAWTVTDARGYYAFRGRRPDEGYFCVISPLPQRRTALNQYRNTTLLFRTGSPTIRPVLSAAADRSTVRAGATVAIRGRAAPTASMAGRQIVLQRLVGRHWRKVGSSYVRPSGRYTLYATPPTRGVHRYRAVTAAVGTLLAGVSPTVRITAG
jgi:hypothetical protein